MNSNTNIELDYGNCGITRFCGKEAYVKDVSLLTVPSEATRPGTK